MQYSVNKVGLEGNEIVSRQTEVKDEKFDAKCVEKWGRRDKCGITLMALGGICIRRSFQPRLFLASQTKQKHKHTTKVQKEICIRKLFLASK